METSELSGAALDWAVAKCEGLGDSPRLRARYMYQQSKGMGYYYSTDWAHGGPIIEREGIDLKRITDALWDAHMKNVNFYEDGSTPLIAAMRCYVAYKLGDEVEIPEELEVTA